MKDDAYLYGKLIFDVNSAYFDNHGGYDFAKQFYTDAYKSAIEIVGGKQFILSTVMHADERNWAMSEALGRDVFHYHLHVVYIPVVENKSYGPRGARTNSWLAQFKAEREQERLAALEHQVEKKEKVLWKVEQKIEVQKRTSATFAEIDSMGRKTLMGKMEFSQQEAEDLKQLAKKGIVADTTIKDSQRDLKSIRRDAQIWK